MFKIGDHVVITEIERPGRIRQICHTVVGTEYEVSYFYNGEYKKTFFFPDELEIKV